MSRRVKVAVVGSGLAGLTAGHLLAATHGSTDVEFEVHLFEKAPSLGMDSSSISLPGNGADQGKEWRIDVPMRSFQGGYYPQLISLYRSLGIAFRKADFSYSFSILSPPDGNRSRRITTAMIYNGASGRAGISMPSIMDEPYLRTKGRGLVVRIATKASVLALFALVTFQTVLCYLRLILMALPFMRPTRVVGMTFREWSQYSIPRGVLATVGGAEGVWKDFVRDVLIPLFSAVCTASEKDVMEHPVEEFLDYIWLTVGTHHYIVVKGVRDVVSRLTSGIQHIHLSCPISAVLIDPSNPQLALVQCATPEGIMTHSGFAHIIFATQATRAVSLLSSYASSLPADSPQRKAVREQVQCLRTFQYRPTIVINHTDDSLMPNNSRDRRDLNLICMHPDVAAEPTPSTSERCVSSSYTMATHVLGSRFGHPVVYQTTNSFVAPREKSILSASWLERAVLTLEAKKALRGLYRGEGRWWWQCPVQAKSALGPLQGAGRLQARGEIGGPGIWICGSYASAGIPLLEGCVVSATNVVEQGVLVCEGVRRRRRQTACLSAYL